MVNILAELQGNPGILFEDTIFHTYFTSNINKLYEK